MTMYLDYQIRIYPNDEQAIILSNLLVNFSKEVNAIIDIFKSEQKVVDIGFSQIRNTVPWDSKIEVIKHANRIFRNAVRNGNKNPRLNDLYCCWTDMNFSIQEFKNLHIQVVKNKNISVKINMSDYVKECLTIGKVVSLKIFRRRNKWIGKIMVATPPKRLEIREAIMGIDMGIKVPAVGVTDTGKIRFFGNGRYR